MKLNHFIYLLFLGFFHLTVNAQLEFDGQLLGQINFGSKNVFGHKIFLGQKAFCGKKKLGSKFWGKIYRVKIIWVKIINN